MDQVVKEMRQEENIAGTCSYQYQDKKYCHRPKAMGSFCVLHYEGEKTPRSFEIAFSKTIEDQRGSNTLDIEGFVFPSPFTLSSVEWDGLKKIIATNATFLDTADFDYATANMGFSNARFEKIASFFKASADEGVNFESATFLDRAIFSECEFRGSASFAKAVFEKRVSFRDTKFYGNAHFSQTRFLGSAEFKSAKFHEQANFSNCHFGSYASLDEVTFKRWANFYGSRFFDGASFYKAKFHDKADFRSANLKSVIFNETNFQIDCNFVGAHLNAVEFIELDMPFGSTLNQSRLNNVVFHSCDLSCLLLLNSMGLESCHFSNIQWQKHFSRWVIADEMLVRWPKSYEKTASAHKASAIVAENTKKLRHGFEQIEPIYRKLRVAYEKHKNYPDAGIFHYGEMEMRRLAKYKSRIRRTFGALDGWYWLLSGYGERWGRSFACFLFIIIISSAIYYQQGTAIKLVQSKPPVTKVQISKNDAKIKKPSKTKVRVERDVKESLALSLKTAFLRGDNFSKSRTWPILGTVIFETITAPLSLALLALAVRRKFKRN